MSLVNDLEFRARLVRIVVVDRSLAGDHALVIALAVRALARLHQRLEQRHCGRN